MSAAAARRRGSLFVIAAPSGAGKTSLVNEVKTRDPSLRVSVSHTTRKQRPTEVPGRDYNFVSVEEFKRLREAGEFLEYAQVFDNFYGTGRAQVEALRNAGHDVILEIDWQGAQQVRKAEPDCKSVFILPPSRAELESRLRNRKTDSNDVIERRLRDAVTDMSHYAEFDYVIVNDEFETAVAQMLTILRGGGTEYGAKRPALAPRLADLLG
ncbi:MAG TPA: guanylate kinase [Steroidobacteraceae bacterium]|nr:guanylate kinase [Steroidobacteraceae bacterium]